MLMTGHRKEVPDITPVLFLLLFPFYNNDVPTFGSLVDIYVEDTTSVIPKNPDDQNRLYNIITDLTLAMQWGKVCLVTFNISHI